MRPITVMPVSAVPGSTRYRRRVVRCRISAPGSAEILPSANRRNRTGTTGGRTTSTTPAAAMTMSWRVSASKVASERSTATLPATATTTRHGPSRSRLRDRAVPATTPMTRRRRDSGGNAAFSWLLHSSRRCATGGLIRKLGRGGPGLRRLSLTPAMGRPTQCADDGPGR